jgi:hypothetical protein
MWGFTPVIPYSRLCIDRIHSEYNDNYGGWLQPIHMLHSSSYVVPLAWGGPRRPASTAEEDKQLERGYHIIWTKLYFQLLLLHGIILSNIIGCCKPYLDCTHGWRRNEAPGPHSSWQNGQRLLKPYNRSTFPLLPWNLQRCRFVEYGVRELDYFRHTNYARSRILDDVTVCGNVTAVLAQLNRSGRSCL